MLSENQAGETVRYLDFLILVRLGVLAARRASCSAWRNTPAHLCHPPAALSWKKIGLVLFTFTDAALPELLQKEWNDRLRN